MTHFTEHAAPLLITVLNPHDQDELLELATARNDVVLVRLPSLGSTADYDRPLANIGALVADVAKRLGDGATLVVLGEIIDLVQVQAMIPREVRYQHWIAIRRTVPLALGNRSLSHAHVGALVYTRYKQSLRHTLTRIEYTFCPACDRTTKDYGGKKHTYHERGTLISDVWRDIECDLADDCGDVYRRFADFFGIAPYRDLVVLDCAALGLQRHNLPEPTPGMSGGINSPNGVDQILVGDCLELLRQMPENSVDFAFVDPPYNLKKKYVGYTDDLAIRDYFAWCDEWIAELARVLKPGSTLALLNIPLWAVRHFLYMQTILRFQSWIVWDALAYPVRLVMPSHYVILCFSKGASRPLPGLTRESRSIRLPSAPRVFDALRPLADDYCLRATCVESRAARGVDDRGSLTDLWGDIHRLKHNSRRVDHPCQLPPHLMYRLITLFSKEGELVMDCFNGAGTTTLAAHQLNRHYLGIDASEVYCEIAQARHAEVQRGLDPFRKQERILTAKNSPVPRLEKQAYAVPKKTLQLEVRRVAAELGHIPTRDELIRRGRYPIEYYDKYFASWGEVRAAARHNGMSDRRSSEPEDGPMLAQESAEQLSLFQAAQTADSGRGSTP